MQLATIGLHSLQTNRQTDDNDAENAVQHSCIASKTVT